MLKRETDYKKKVAKVLYIFYRDKKYKKSLSAKKYFAGN